MNRWRRALLCTLALMSLSMLAGAAATEQPRVLVRSDGSPAPTAAVAGEGDKVARVNKWTLGIAGGLLEGSFIRFASELAKAFDSGEELRILPIVSYGAAENLRDLLYLRGIDLAITHADVFDMFKRSGEAKDPEGRINYISQMHITDFYVYARPEIKSLEDLAGRKVGFHAKGSGPSVTGPMMFQRLGITVDPVFINHSFALEKMKSGEIAAIFQLGARPQDLFAKLKPEPGFHFLPISWGPKFADYYLPTRLTHDDYPQLIEPGATIDTLGVPVVLAVYNWPRNSDRSRRVQRFVHSFFTRFDKLLQPAFHPMWKDINLAARVPGWTRYWAAEDELAALARAPATGATGAAPAAGGARMDDALFQEFLAWKQKQKASP